MESSLSKAQVQALAVATSADLNKLVSDSGQWSPIFGDQPDKVLFTNVTPVKESREWEGNTYWSMKYADPQGILSNGINIVRGAEDKPLLNVGVFFALRDYVGPKTTFTAGVTFRVFAY